MEIQNKNLIQDIPTVKISKQGIFNQGKTDYIVRGDNSLLHHVNIMDWFVKQLKNNGVIKANKNDGKIIYFKCLGGGRIEHNYKGHKCFIYGYSQSYGIVDHKIAQNLISKSLGYKMSEIKTSQQGY